MCKYYLCGFCPYEEFRKTKNDFGECPKVHDVSCKEQWEGLSDREKDRYGFERDLKRWLDDLEDDLRKRKEANMKRIGAVQKPVYMADDQAAMDALTKQIEEVLAQAQVLGEEGDIDGAEAATIEADRLKESFEMLKRQAEARSGNNAIKGLVQSVCPVSGLIISDEEARQDDHHRGRNYNAWKKVHQKHAELTELLEKRREARRERSPDGDGRHRERRSDRDRYRHHDDRHHDDRRRRRHDTSRRRSRSRSGERFKKPEKETVSKNDVHSTRQDSPEEGEAPLEAYIQA